MKVVIFGTGYVGLTTGTALAFLGNQVTCLDVNQAKIDLLRTGKSPIYEPGIEELMRLAGDNLRFEIDPEPSLRDADVVFIAVGTPPGTEGKPDLVYVEEAAGTIGRYLKSEFAVVVNKSTVPIGSGHWVEALISQAGGKNFCVASNPEFLREGSAISDILYPDRIVVGASDPRASDLLIRMYGSVLQQTFTPPNFLPRPDGFGTIPLVTTDWASAELIKYAANAFLSTKISFANEMAALAERVGADITHITRGMGLDDRIGGRFLQAGLGWGGSCFGKDSAALIATADEYGLRLPIVEAARQVNYAQRDLVVTKLQAELKILKGRTVGILGLAFKPNTDDLRDAPALDIATKLIERGVRVQGHDPVAMERVSSMHPGITLCESPEAVARGAHAVLLATEWSDYRELPWEQMAGEMANPLIVDGRNFLDRGRLEKAGFRVVGIGRG